MPALERKRLDVSVDLDLYRRLKKCATADGRTLNAQMGWFLRQAIEAWEEEWLDEHCDCVAAVTESAARRPS